MASIREIERAALNLRWRIWQMLHKDLLPGQKVDSRLVLDPELAAHALGLDYQYYDDLGSAGGVAGSRDIAGCFLRRERRILISQRFGYNAQRFTGAHEIGHALLHGHLPRMDLHRDRPIYGLSASYQPRDRIEREADRFAAAFLIPPKYLRKQFAARFGTESLVFDETTAFWLNPSDYGTLVHAEAGSLERLRALSKATSFAGRNFDSLVTVFEVSVDTMALRLQELGLVQEPE